MSADEGPLQRYPGRADQDYEGQGSEPPRSGSVRAQSPRYGSPRSQSPRYRPPRTERPREDQGRRLRLTPVRSLVFVAIVGSMAMIGYGLIRRDRTQIPLLAAGMIILGITLVGAGFWAARAAWLDARRGHTGSAFVGALIGGLCVLAGSVSLATAVVLALIWETA